MRRLATAVLLTAACAAGAWIASRVAERIALQDLHHRANAALDLHTANLDGALDKFRMLGPLIAKRTDVVDYFRGDRSPEETAEADLMLGRLAGMSGVETIAFAELNGEVFASSDPAGATGRTVNIPDVRDDFVAALQGRLGRYHDAEDDTGAGYHFAAPVRDGTIVIGAVLVRASLDTVEQAWALTPDPVLASDADGFVVLANRYWWQGMTLHRDTDPGNQQSVLRLRSKDRAGTSAVTLAEGDKSPGEFIEHVKPLPLLGWTLHVFAGTGPVDRAMTSAAVIAALASLTLALAGWLVLERRRQLIARVRLERAAALRLERRVRDRTAALTAANTSLAREIGEHQATEKQLRQAQADLVQAAKLAALGQMSAALAHEFNQPLAAIRSNADNAGMLIDRDRAADAKENLGRIAGMVDRMARLGRNLKTFARRPGDRTSPVPLRTVIGEVVMLMSARTGKSGTEVAVDMPDEEIMVEAGPVRLQQVLVNLVTNALDACEGRNDTRITISATRDDEFATISVADTGPGIDAEILGQVFDPFFTTKAAGVGLGLGLSIAYNIVRDFNGTLVARNREDGGAVFEVRLPLARRTETAAE